MSFFLHKIIVTFGPATDDTGANFSNSLLKPVIMKKLFLSYSACIAASLCLSSNALAQLPNLVVNGDFEAQKTTNLSGSFSNVACRFVDAVQRKGDDLASWEGSNSGTPDYFATNEPAGSIVTPSNAFPGVFDSYNYNSSSHNGALGLYACTLTGNPGSNTYTEYAYQQLAKPLLGDHDYYASMRVLNASKTKYATTMGLDITVNDPTDFANNPNYFRANGLAIGTYKHSGCGIQSATVVSSSTQWTQVAGIFRGVAGAKYLNVGNFQFNNYQLVRPNAAFAEANFSGYYYVDQIEIYQLPTAGLNSTINCGGVARIGEGDGIPGASYEWRISGQSTIFSNTILIQVTPSYTTTYTLTVNLPDGSKSTSSVTVTVNPPTAGPNKSICPGSSVVIGQGCNIPGASYAWSGGGIFANNIQTSVSPANTATYTLTVTLPNGNVSTSSTVVEVLSGAALTSPDINLARQGATTPPSNLYDVRVNNVDGATSYTLVAEIPNGNGGWTYTNTYQADTYTGPDNPDFNEVRGFTTFHTDYIGPATSGTTSNTPINNPATYRLTVTARSACNSVTTQRVVTLPAYGGGYEESNLTSPTTAYPNPAAESLRIPEGAAGATLVNDKGRAVGRRNSSGELDVRSLPEGLYNLQMMKNGKLINQRIQVKH